MQAITLAKNSSQITTVKTIRISKEGDSIYWSVSGFKGSVFVTVKVNSKTGVVVN